MKYDVIGIENPLIDLLAQVPDRFLKDLGLEKNKMFLIGLDEIQALLKALENVKVVAEPGGSCANTMIGIAQLGGRVAYCGKVGGDAYGQLYIDKMTEAHVDTFVKADGSLTGSTVILVTPDAARTMNTFLGACRELGPNNIPVQAIQDSKRLYITGYLWDTDDQKEAALLALNTARKAGVEVCLSLSDPFCVNRHKNDFWTILTDYVDTVFANQEEALALTGTDNAQQAMRELRKVTRQAVITLGSHGALVTEGAETVYVDPFPVTPVDSTGAGDAFAAGFLYGKSQNASLLQCGRLGAYFAGQVITHMGPRLRGDVRQTLSAVLDDPR